MWWFSEYCKDILIPLAQAAVMAIVGLYATFKGRAYIERNTLEDNMIFNEEVLALVYEIRDKITYIRGMMSSSSEFLPRDKDDNETKEQTAALNKAYIIQKRFENCENSFNKFYNMRHRFMAKYGRKSAIFFNALHEKIIEIGTAINMLVYYWPKQAEYGKLVRSPIIVSEEKQEKAEKRREEILKYEMIIWGHPDDDFGKGVKEVIENLEAFLNENFNE